MQLFPYLVIFFLFLLQALRPVDTTCVQQSNCVCKNDDGGGIVNLTEIASKQQNQRAPFKSEKDVKGSIFYYNPCYSFTEPDLRMPYQVCTPRDNVAVCQNDGYELYNVGQQNSVTFSGSSSDNSVEVAYSTPSDVYGNLKKTIIKLKCDESIHPGTLASSGEYPIDQYNLIFTSKCCCSNACGTVVNRSSSGSGLSVGSILLIVFFVLLIVYFVGGVLYLKFAREAQGVDLVPNHRFWATLPGLIKDGIVFLIGKCRGTTPQYAGL